MRAFHFTADQLRNGDPIPPIGEWLEYTGKLCPASLAYTPASIRGTPCDTLPEICSMPWNSKAILFRTAIPSTNGLVVAVKLSPLSTRSLYYESLLAGAHRKCCTSGMRRRSSKSTSPQATNR